MIIIVENCEVDYIAKKEFTGISICLWHKWVFEWNRTKFISYCNLDDLSDSSKLIWVFD